MSCGEGEEGFRVEQDDRFGMDEFISELSNYCLLKWDCFVMDEFISELSNYCLLKWGLCREITHLSHWREIMYLSPTN